MTNPDAAPDTLVIERVMPHSPEKIWRALTQAPLIEEWLMRNDFAPVVGHRFNLRTEPMAHWNGVVDCEVLAVEPNKRLSYAWNTSGAHAEAVLKTVVTAVESGGKARAKRGGTHSERTIATFLFRKVSLESVLSTDELPAYRWIGRKFRADLGVNHSAGEDVGNDRNVAAQAHSNTAESWNATVTRAINGVWHFISIKHLDRSCTETAFRRNHRDHDARRSPLFGGNVGRVPWKVLTA